MRQHANWSELSTVQKLSGSKFLQHLTDVRQLSGALGPQHSRCSLLLPGWRCWMPMFSWWQTFSKWATRGLSFARSTLQYEFKYRQARKETRASSQRRFPSQKVPTELGRTKFRQVGRSLIGGSIENKKQAHGQHHGNSPLSRHPPERCNCSPTAPKGLLLPAAFPSKAGDVW